MVKQAKIYKQKGQNKYSINKNVMRETLPLKLHEQFCQTSHLPVKIELVSGWFYDSSLLPQPNSPLGRQVG